MKAVFCCDSCDADFTIIHSLAESHYQVTCCPFCGEELDLDEIEEYDDDDY